MVMKFGNGGMKTMNKLSAKDQEIIGVMKLRNRKAQENPHEGRKREKSLYPDTTYDINQPLRKRIRHF